jgi:peptidase M23-like protein
VPPRPHPLVLVTLAVACFVVAFLVAPRSALPSAPYGSAAYAVASVTPARAPAAAAARSATPVRPPVARSAAPSHATWRWPLRGRVVGAFRISPRAPFARGQRRGIDVAAPAGTTVRAACAGRITFAGPVPRHGLAVTARCGALVATYLRLGHLAIRRGAHAEIGQRLGGLGPSGRLRLGARRAGDRRGYVDPLALLRDPAPTAPPVLGPAPRRQRPRPAPAPIGGPRPARTPPEPRDVPWPAYPALALIATALPVGSLVHRRRRRAAAAVALAHEGP